MRAFLKYCTVFLCAGIAALSLSACGAPPKETTPPTLAPIVLPTAPVQETVPAADPQKQVESLTVVMDAGDLYTLDSYPNLKTLDLSGSVCYGPILDYMENHPEVDVTFTVSFGDITVSNKAASAALEPGRFSFETLLENLQYLPNLTTLTVPEGTLTAEQTAQIRTVYPKLALNYAVTLLGSTYGPGDTQIDLSSMGAGQVEEACGKLSLMTAVTDVTLNNSLSLEDVDKLQTAAPHITFHYSFTLFGQTISTADTEVIYKKAGIGNDGEAQIRQALTVLDRCQRFVLDNCGLDYEVLAKIREDFRDGPKVVWRVYYGVDGRYNLLTDAETLRAVYNVTDTTCEPMKYCEDVKYMDIGHNEYLTDLSFIGHMPNIEVVIASGCAVTELVELDNCKKLTWLELAYCYKLKDIDCLSGCESLRFLNLSFTSVNNYEPLDPLPLERFVCLSPKASTKEQNTFTAVHPKGECITVFYGYSNPYGYGWRYDDNGKTFNEYYKTVVRKAFNYDELEKYLPKEDK